jgi:hypothetical protein
MRPTAMHGKKLFLGAAGNSIKVSDCGRGRDEIKIS